jgi:ribosomal-protein-alanine N-acetyltransferase
MKRNTFSTKRFIVRPLKLSDFNQWVEANTIKKAPKNKYDGTPLPLKYCNKKFYQEVLERHKTRAKNDEVYIWNIFDKKTKKIVGAIDIWVITRRNIAKGNLGYKIFNKYWRQGIAEEVLNVVVPKILITLKLNRLEAAIDPDNKPSIKLVQKLCFIKEGIRKNYWYQNNKWEDQVVFVVDRALLKISKLKI